MSTRCQIGFYEAEEKDLDNFEALIYRHSDGYPDTEHGVLAAIVPFLQLKILNMQPPDFYSGCATSTITTEGLKRQRVMAINNSLAH